ncbi:hypothetical protein Msil_0181 [Methylocella silvestris BL2]|uniref:Secreted protein n=1 Tax=Methylocella silvestris (strain DSM 15510 / CIP 108128 / LMG 27833 / NCIMB 13906 / BL2) TaxID=395965 RepID=B8EN27_METSB|nr:hypothetical protein [Methylocella silvestris]ACK49162.1 hypothetical protein Msil_0181 [Methylocella silvestris BL2]
MKLISKGYFALFMAGAAVFGVSATVRADEVTTTTRTREAPSEPGVIVGVPGVVGVEVGRSSAEHGCETRKETRTDDETGDSVSRKTTNCE